MSGNGDKMLRVAPEEVRKRYIKERNSLQNGQTQLIHSLASVDTWRIQLASVPSPQQPIDSNTNNNNRHLDHWASKGLLWLRREKPLELIPPVLSIETKALRPQIHVRFRDINQRPGSIPSSIPEDSDGPLYYY
jgi:hypothetical protein